MKKASNYVKNITNQTDNNMIEVRGHKIRKQYSKSGCKKWNLFSNVPMFSGFGYLPDNENILVGIEDDHLYFIYLKVPKIIGNVVRFRDYESSNFMWVSTEKKAEFGSKITIDKTGNFLVHLPTGVYCNVDQPPSKTRNKNKFTTQNNNEIKWDGTNFTITRKNLDEKDTEIVSEEDLRSERIEEYIEENVDLDMPTNTDYIDDVDRCQTPKPMAYIYYEMSDGEFPENQDGEFEPPKQDEYAEYAYQYFKENSEENKYFDEKYKPAWMQRLKNAWASLTRDVHFSFMMFKEQNKSDAFEDVEFDMEKDVNEGVDFIVEDEDQEYHINLFVDTSKSREFLEKKKEHRHPEKNDVTELEVPLKIDGSKKEISTNGRRDMWLFSDKHIEGVKEVIKQDKFVSIDNRTGKILCRKK